MNPQQDKLKEIRTAVHHNQTSKNNFAKKECGRRNRSARFQDLCSYTNSGRVVWAVGRACRSVDRIENPETRPSDCWQRFTGKSATQCNGLSDERDDRVGRKESWDNNQRGQSPSPACTAHSWKLLLLIFFSSWFGSQGASTKQTQETGREQICTAIEAREKGYGNRFILLHLIALYCPPWPLCDLWLQWLASLGFLKYIS